MIDSHCHLDDPRVDFETAVRSAQKWGVKGAVIPGYGPERWPRQNELLLLPGDFTLWGGFGLHPWALQPEHKAQEIASTLQQGWKRYSQAWGSRLVAIGEFGLDRSPAMSNRPWELQKAVFTEHLKLAAQSQLPVILHLVRADGEALKLLACDPPPRGGVVHGYTSHAETLPRYGEHGLSFGFGAGLLRYAKVRKALQATPLDRLLFETDDPLGTSLEQIVQAASQILGKSVEYLRKQHSENCVKVFNL